MRMFLHNAHRATDLLPEGLEVGGELREEEEGDEPSLRGSELLVGSGHWGTGTGTGARPLSPNNSGEPQDQDQEQQVPDE